MICSFLLIFNERFVTQDLFVCGSFQRKLENEKSVAITKIIHYKNINCDGDADCNAFAEIQLSELLTYYFLRKTLRDF